jgi:GNAT superfamily N-acetyltransferase
MKRPFPRGGKVPLPFLRQAIETFVRGYSVGRGMTHPVEIVRMDDVWAIRDAPRRKPGTARNEEWVFLNQPPQWIHQRASTESRSRYFVSELVPEGEDDTESRDAFRALGYRLVVTQPFFVHFLERIPKAPSPVRLEQVRTADAAAALGRATRSRPLAGEFLEPKAPFRQYIARDGETVVGWVRSVPVDRMAWCANLGVPPAWRRRGIGRALLLKMLRDDRSLGFQCSVLLSSHTGALLYPQIGYERIGTLYIYGLRRRG